MDRLIIIPKEGFEAEYSRDLFDDHIAGPYLQSIGYTRNENGIVGKKSSGEDDLRAIIRTYAEVEKSPDGIKYWDSPSNNPKYVDWKDYWKAAELPDCFEEKEFPKEWLSTETTEVEK